LRTSRADRHTDQFLGLAVDADGIAWVGATALYDGDIAGGALIRMDPNTGEYQMFRSSQGWPFPGDVVTPWAVTPDGRLWMQYDDSNYSYTERALRYDGTNGAFLSQASRNVAACRSADRGLRSTHSRRLRAWMTVSRGIVFHGSVPGPGGGRR
jgi:streptogramin lyase